VRDFVHTHWAEWLVLELEEPGEEEDEAELEWKRYRGVVADAVAKRRRDEK